MENDGDEHAGARGLGGDPAAPPVHPEDVATSLSSLSSLLRPCHCGGRCFVVVISLVASCCCVAVAAATGPFAAVVAVCGFVLLLAIVIWRGAGIM